MTKAPHRHCCNRQNLTRNQKLVLDLLDASPTPMTAYQLLEQLQSAGLRNPPQVYRALERLVARGLAHRIASRNAYLTCQRRQCSSEALTAFALCAACGEALELDPRKLGPLLRPLLGQEGFAAQSGSIEILGHCHRCTAPH